MESVMDPVPNEDDGGGKDEDEEETEEEIVVDQISQEQGVEERNNETESSSQSGMLPREELPETDPVPTTSDELDQNQSELPGTANLAGSLSQDITLQESEQSTLLSESEDAPASSSDGDRPSHSSQSSQSNDAREIEKREVSVNFRGADLDLQSRPQFTTDQDHPGCVETTDESEPTRGTATWWMEAQKELKRRQDLFLLKSET